MPQSQQWYIRGGRVIDPATARDETTDLFIVDARLMPAPASPPAGANIVDARGLLVVPGLIDLHVHLREPGNEAAETVATGCAAAARGGFVTVVAMPNTTPPMDTPAAVRDLSARAAAAGSVRVLPAACITRGRQGRELADLSSLADAGAVAFTDDGASVPEEALMREAMLTAAALRRPIFDHAEDQTLAGSGVMHAGTYARRWELPGIPPEAETTMVARDLRLAESTGCALHLQHLSCGESVRLLRDARRRGLRVSAEVTPHHLALTEANVWPDDARYKMNPPLRSREDRSALLAAVADGTIPALATDHAPHTAEAKRTDFRRAPFGVIGLETAVAVTHTVLVEPGVMGLVEWVQRWTLGPAAILGLPVPSLRPGTPADLTILDVTTRWTIRSREFVSKSRNTPFEGWTVTGRVMWTFRDGQPIWSPAGPGR